MALTREQRRNLAIARQRSAHDSPRVRLALIEAMKVESNYRNLNYGDRDSRGVLQQRRQYYPHSGQNVAYDIDQFLSRARRADRGFHGSAGQLAQAVQRSAFPGRYDQHAQEARSLLGGPMASNPSFALAGRLGASGGATGASQGVNPVFTSLIQSSNELAAGHMPGSGELLNALAEARQAASQPSEPAQQLAGSVMSDGGGRGGGGGINELFYDPLGAIKHGQNIAPIGGHSDHVHVSLANEGAQKQALALARRMGLHVGEFDDSNVHPVHVSGSYHYKHYRRGDPMREAADVSGNARQMAAFYRRVARRYR